MGSDKNFFKKQGIKFAAPLAYTAPLCYDKTVKGD